MTLRNEKQKFLYASFGIFVILLAVILGAFGAHVLKDTLGDKGATIWKTAVLYQFIHGLALLSLGHYASQWSGLFQKLVLGLMMLGIVLFSGSLYLLATVSNEMVRSIAGPSTPLGGLLFIAAWILVIIAIWKNYKE